MPDLIRHPAMHAMNSRTPDQVRGDDEKYISVVALRRLHNLGQPPAHILGVKAEDQRPMRPDPRPAEPALAHRLELRLGGVYGGGDRKRTRPTSKHHCTTP